MDRLDIGSLCRCLCGRLLARLVASGVEIKCHRCQRIVVLPLEGHREIKLAASPVRLIAKKGAG